MSFKKDMSSLNVSPANNNNKINNSNTNNNHHHHHHHNKQNYFESSNKKTSSNLETEIDEFYDNKDSVFSKYQNLI